MLGRTGTLCDALRELGISAPEGVVATGSASGSHSGSGSSSDGGGRGSSSGEEGEQGRGEGDDSIDSEPTAEEKRLFDELAADRENQDDEGYLDVTLEDEADAADM